jgi:glycosyltransferase involved in cell wall biosynthesis
MILGIDGINVRGGGIVHIVNVLKFYNYKDTKFKKIVIWGNNELLSQIQNQKIIKIHYPIFEKFFIFRIIWQLIFFKKEIENKKCRIIFNLSSYDLSFFKPSLTFYQNVLPLVNNELKKYNLFHRIKFFFQKKFFLFSLKKSSHNLFPSYYARDIFLKTKYTSKKKTSVIYHGAVNRIKKNYKKGTIKLIYISTIDFYKNHNNLIKAVCDLKDTFDIQLHIYGSAFKPCFNNLKNNFLAINKDKKIVKYLNVFDKNKNILKSKYDILVHASSCESFGIPLVEGIVSGLKVVCSDIQVFREITKYFKVNYFDPKDIVSIRNAIIKAINTNLKNNNVNIAKSKFSWKNCSINTFALLEKIVYEKKNIINFS